MNMSLVKLCFIKSRIVNPKLMKSKLMKSKLIVSFQMRIELVRISLFSFYNSYYVPKRKKWNRNRSSVLHATCTCDIPNDNDSFNI